MFCEGCDVDKVGKLVFILRGPPGESFSNDVVMRHIDFNDEKRENAKESAGAFVCALGDGKSDRLFIDVFGRFFRGEMQLTPVPFGLFSERADALGLPGVVLAGPATGCDVHEPDRPEQGRQFSVAWGSFGHG